MIKLPSATMSEINEAHVHTSKDLMATSCQLIDFAARRI